MTSGVTCHHRLWTAHTDKRRRAWHAIIDFGQHTRSNDVGRGMPSSPLGSTNGQTTSGVAFHHRFCVAQAVIWRRAWHAIIAFAQHIVERPRAWHAIITFGKHTPSNDVGRGMPSSTLGSTNDRTTFGMACHHRLWASHQSNNVRRFMPSSPLDGKHGRTTSGVACNHRLWEAQAVERHRAWHAIIALGQHRRSDGVGRGMPP